MRTTPRKGNVIDAIRWTKAKADAIEHTRGSEDWNCEMHDAAEKILAAAAVRPMAEVLYPKEVGWAREFIKRNLERLQADVLLQFVEVEQDESNYGPLRFEPVRSRRD